jgi:hypothetical protein
MLPPVPVLLRSKKRLSMEPGTSWEEELLLTGLSPGASPGVGGLLTSVVLTRTLWSRCVVLRVVQQSRAELSVHVTCDLGQFLESPWYLESLWIAVKVNRGNMWKEHRTVPDILQAQHTYNGC